jgi:hypothetical protein
LRLFSFAPLLREPDLFFFPSNNSSNVDIRHATATSFPRHSKELFDKAPVGHQRDSAFLATHGGTQMLVTFAAILVIIGFKFSPFIPIPAISDLVYIKGKAFVQKG